MLLLQMLQMVELFAAYSPNRTNWIDIIINVLAAVAAAFLVGFIERIVTLENDLITGKSKTALKVLFGIFAFICLRTIVFVLLKKK